MYVYLGDEPTPRQNEYLRLYRARFATRDFLSYNAKYIYP